MRKKTAVVYGGNGFLGHHMARRLKTQGYWVRVVDINEYAYGDKDYADEYVIGDLRDQKVSCENLFVNDETSFDELYVFASWMGGAGVIFTGEYDDEILYNALSIDLNVVKCAAEIGVGKIFWSGSACSYNADLQRDPHNTGLSEDSQYPAAPDSDYGFGKLASQRIYQAFKRNRGLNVRMAIFHNIFGIESAWDNKKEKFPAAVCRKVSMAQDGTSISVWGDGEQTRSFCWVDDAIDGVQKLMESDYTFPVNIGSDRLISVNDLARMVIKISGKQLTIQHEESNAIGVRGRCSDNTLCKKILNWSPPTSLEYGMEKLYWWVSEQVKKTQPAES